MLKLPGASVCSVEFTPKGLILGLRRPRNRMLVCPCGTKTWAHYDQSRRMWRHLNFGTTRVFLEADVYRLECRRCGLVRTEQVPWARAGARLTRDFEDVIGWLAQRADKTTVAKLLGCAWETVDRAAKRLVDEHLDDARLDELYRIGIDEISYKRGHKYLTVIADHDSGRVVWVSLDRNRQAVDQFFDALGEDRTAALQVVTMDGSSVYRPAVQGRAGHATICLDPFHVIKWTNEALESFHQTQPQPPVDWIKGHPRNRSWQRLRVALRTGSENLDDNQRALVNGIRRHNYRLYRAWELKEQLRELYRSVEPEHAPRYLKRWCTSALRSKIRAFEVLARRIKKHFDAVIAAVQLGLSNSRLEGINSKIRVIQRRGYGHPSPASLITMVYLCLAGINLSLPTQR
jgi:transposase